MTPNTKATADQSHAGALLPCPFCGGRAVMRNDDDPGYPFYITFDHDDDCVMYAVPTDLFRSFATETEAVAVWNRRTASHAGATDEQVERAEQAFRQANIEWFESKGHPAQVEHWRTWKFDPVEDHRAKDGYLSRINLDIFLRSLEILAAMPTPEPAPQQGEPVELLRRALAYLPSTLGVTRDVRAFLDTAPTPPPSGDAVLVTQDDAHKIAVAVIKEACETDPADPESDDTILINVSDLRAIVYGCVEDHEFFPVPAPPPAAASEPVAQRDRAVALLHDYVRFAGETAGKCLALAMSSDHPAPDQVLMGIFQASQDLAAKGGPILAGLSPPAAPVQGEG